MAREVRKSVVEYCVNTGTPSWHQARAGHASSSAMCFFNKRQAEKYQKRHVKQHPHEPAFITKRRVFRTFKVGK